MTCHIIKKVVIAPTRVLYAAKQLPIYQISHIPIPKSYYNCAQNKNVSPIGPTESLPTQTFTITLVPG